MRTRATIPIRHATRIRPAARRSLGATPEPTRPSRPGMDALLTADEVAQMLQVTKAWVYAETRAKRMPHVPLGRYVRYRRSTVTQWITNLERQNYRGGRVPISEE
jgi:excisionase family DNA binding protein